MSLGLVVIINGNAMPASQFLLWPTFRPATSLYFKYLSLNRPRFMFGNAHRNANTDVGGICRESPSTVNSH
jgi:hypothetical protein